MTTLEDIRRLERLEMDHAIARHTWLMAVAEYTGFEIKTVEHCSGVRVWLVPPALVAIVGCMAAVIQ